jgi:hypothetical protein
MAHIPTKRDDAALLNGDAGAFAELYRRHEDAILGYFLGRTRDSPGPIGLGQYFAGQRARPATRVDPAQAAAFAILRRPLAPDDAIPASWRSTVDAGAYGANYALARRARDLPAGFAAWVVPGNGSLCLLTTGGSTCGPHPLPRGFALESGSSTLDPHSESIIGLVPDNVRSVTITTGHHVRLTVAVHDNFYAADVRGGISYVSESHR